MRLPSVAVAVLAATLLHVVSVGPSVRLCHHCAERPAMFSVAPVPLMPVAVSAASATVTLTVSAALLPPRSSVTTRENSQASSIAASAGTVKLALASPTSARTPVVLLSSRVQAYSRLALLPSGSSDLLPSSVTVSPASTYWSKPAFAIGRAFGGGPLGTNDGTNGAGAGVGVATGQSHEGSASPGAAGSAAGRVSASSMSA